MTKHIIKRQIIELTVPNAAAASAIQNEVSRVYRQRIVPLIDQYCSELGAPDRLYRIDSLELDLGTLDAQDLEEQFVAKVKMTLRPALQAQINEQEAASPAEAPKTRSALELFSMFVSTGSLPWWADQNQPDLLAANLQQLLHEETPAAFTKLLQTLLRSPNTRRRIVHQYADAQLGQIGALLVPRHGENFAQEISKLLSTLQQTQTGQTWPAARLRHSIWSHTLEVAALGGQQHTLMEFRQAVLERTANEIGRAILREMVSDAPSADTLTQKLAQLRAASDTPLAAAWAELQNLAPLFSETLREQLQQALRQSTPSNAATRILNLLKPTEYTDLTRIFESALTRPGQPGSELATQLRTLESRGGALTEAWTLLRGLALRLPAPAQERWLAVFAAADGHPTAEDIIRFLGATPTESGLRPEERARLLNLLHPQDDAASAIDLRFSKSDETPVNNAGLVILWPFLSSFFAHRKLLEDRDFKDLAARQRAVGLLQVLASGQAEFPEYLLPLNKLLCGLELTHPFDFGPPLRKTEQKECKSLLQAVIAQAPILNNISADGLRGSFLLRPGLLSNRDGHWLLRVERLTYDIVLERFPWNWEWVRLPWMQVPLRVEW